MHIVTTHYTTTYVHTLLVTLTCTYTCIGEVKVISTDIRLPDYIMAKG